MRKPLIILILLFCFLGLLGQDFWEPIYESEGRIFDITQNSMGHLFIGTDYGVFASYNNGDNWVQTSLSSGCGAIENYNDTLYCANQGSIYKSIDYGETWEATGYNQPCNLIFRDSNHNLFASYGFGYGVYKSDESEENWDLVLELNGTMITKSMLEAPDGSLLAAVTDFMGTGGIYRSTNQGEDWEYFALESHYLTSLVSDSNNILYAGTTGNHNTFAHGVYASEDFGSNWDYITSGYLVESMVIDSEDNLYFGCSNTFESGVYKSDDFGVSWDYIESDLITGTSPVQKIYIPSDNYVYAINNNGGGLNYLFRSQDTIVTSTSSVVVDDNGINLRNYPNPFYSSCRGLGSNTKISFNLTGNKQANINIFNIKGQLIRTLDCRKTNEVRWNGRTKDNLEASSGVYFYKLLVDSKYISTKKCILLK